MPASALLFSPPDLAIRLLPLRERSPTPGTQRVECRVAASVVCLAPLHFRRRPARPVSCYAFFKGWLLLSQPPGCLSRSTSFPTKHTFRDLSRRSGLFPSRPRTFSPAV